MDIDYDDPQFQEQWCAERRAEVIAYLFKEQLRHASVQNNPEWFVAPYVSIWRVKSAKPSESGWWVICGDLPTDYVSAEGIDGPRQVMDCISKRWSDISEYMMRGEAHPHVRIGEPKSWPELGPLLQARASILRGWVNDDEIWEEDDS